MVKIAVLGAGVNGVTCALRLKERYKHLDVVLIANEFSPNTTGDGSGGLWYPYLCGKTPQQHLTKWGGETYKFIHQMWLDGGYDVSLMPIYALYRQGEGPQRPEWADLVFGYRDLEERQLEYLSRLYSVKYVAGHTFTTFIVPPPKLISHLYHRFCDAGGEVLKATVRSLQCPLLDKFAVVVNCTGLGARDIVPDGRVFSIRGQISKVRAPWINDTVVDKDSGHYIIPNAETCVLGGTHQENDYNTKEDTTDTDFIINGCTTMIPGLKNASVVNTWVGLRPGRQAIRIDLEDINGKLYMHNYGHGGSGLTLFWGCATEVLSLLEPRLDIFNHNKTSKL